MQVGTAWAKYVKKMSQLDSTATKKVKAFITNYKGGFQFTNEDDMLDLINYAYGISTKYGEGAASLACELYDSIGLKSKVFLEAAEPAEVASYREVATAIRGTAKSGNVETVSSSIGRLVKRTGADTTLQNSIRDGAEFAWIPNGDTCAFCLTLAANGWQKASKDSIKDGHAKHIHANCDCEYAIRFNSDTEYKGYDPDKYAEMYYNADASSQGFDPNRPRGQQWQSLSTARINGMRREFYAENKAKINAQKRSAYAKRKELNSPKAEETNVN